MNRTTCCLLNQGFASTRLTPLSSGCSCHRRTADLLHLRFGINLGSLNRLVSPWSRQRVGARKFGVHFRASIGKAIDNMLAGYADNSFLSRCGDVHCDSDDCGFCVICRIQCRTDGIAGAAAADERKAPLRSDSINRGKVDTVLHSSGIHRER